jgi:hypothetical protein
LSRYGDDPMGHLTLGIARSPCTELVGFHRFEPVMLSGIAPARGSSNYPTRNFAQDLRTSPYGLDHIFVSIMSDSRRLAYGL